MFSRITRAEYDAIKALNASGAKHLLPPHGSPAVFAHRRANPEPDKAAWAFGRYFHALELEPEEVALRFGNLPPKPSLSHLRKKDGSPYANPAASVQGKALLAEWDDACDLHRALNPGMVMLSPDDSALGVQMLGVLRANRAWQDLHDGDPAVHNEWSLTWTDEATGVACKGQCDRVFIPWDGAPTIVDLKTDGGADFGGGDVQWEAIRWGWHRQAAFYVDGLAANGHPGARFVWAVISKAAPHEVAIYEAGEDLLDAGRAEMRLACELYRDCAAAGVWPTAQETGLVPRVIGVPKGYRAPQIFGGGQ